MTKEVTFEEFENAISIVKTYQTQLALNIAKASEELKELSSNAYITKDNVLRDLNCSVRLYNQLRAHGENCGVELRHDTKLSELSKLSYSKFYNSRCVGKNTLYELKEICHFLNITLKP